VGGGGGGGTTKVANTPLTPFIFSLCYTK